MTFDKLGYADSDLVGIGFDECVFNKERITELEHSVAGWQISPTQERNTVRAPFTAGGSALRTQWTELIWDGGSIPQEPVVRFTGICHHPYVLNVSTGKEIKVRVDLASGEELQVDMAAHTVHRDGVMVWGYTGRWFTVTPGDVIEAGAEGIGAGFTAEVDVRDDGLIARAKGGVASLSLFVHSTPEIDVTRIGSGAAALAGAGGRQGVGAGKLVGAGGGASKKERDYS